MKRLRELRAEKIERLDEQYAQLRESLTKGFAEQPFNRKGQRSQSTILSGMKVTVEGIQELNRTLKLVSQK
jgi:hypothetical protein